MGKDTLQDYVNNFGKLLPKSANSNYHPASFTKLIRHMYGFFHTEVLKPQPFDEYCESVANILADANTVKAQPKLDELKAKIQEFKDLLPSLSRSSLEAKDQQENKYIQ